MGETKTRRHRLVAENETGWVAPRRMEGNLVLLTAILASISCAANTDSVVPEVSFLDIESGAQSKQQAVKRAVQIMLQTRSEDSCRVLANSTIKEIEDNVKSAQTTLNNLSNGTECKYIGGDEVDRRREYKELASEDASNATAAVYAIVDSTLDLTTSFGALLDGDGCDWWLANNKYIKKKKAYAAAVAYNDSKTARLAEADAALADAEGNADHEQHECKCHEQKKHGSEWISANSDDEENQEAWDDAYRMLCVLDEVDAANCTIPDCPKVYKPALDDDVKNEKCTFAPTATPTNAPSEQPTATPTVVPTRVPTSAPSTVPTSAPSAVPTRWPTTPSPTRWPTTPSPTGECEMSEQESNSTLCTEVNAKFDEISEESASSSVCENERKTEYSEICNQDGVEDECPVSCNWNCYPSCDDYQAADSGSGSDDEEMIELESQPVIK